MNGRRRVMMGNQSQGRLPSSLQEVEYLESTGEQWIDTGVLIDSASTRVKYKFKTLAAASGNHIVIGAKSGDAYAYNLYLSNFTTKKFAYRFGGPDNLLQVFTVGQIYETDCIANNGNVSVSVGGTQYTFPYTDSLLPLDYSLYLFATNSNGTVYRLSTLALYSMEIYAGETQRNFVPCRVTSSSWVNELGNAVPIGTKGMYDMVNGVLYTNRGTGADFIAGPDITALDNIAYENLTYRQIFENNNLLSIYPGFDNGSYSPLVAGTSVELTTEDSYTPNYSIKCFGTSSKQIGKSRITLYGKIYGFAKVKVNRYVRGYAGIDFDGSICSLERTTDGWETISGEKTLSSTGVLSNLLIGTVSAANIDSYMDSPVVIASSIFTNAPSLATLTALYDTYLSLKLAGN